MLNYPQRCRGDIDVARYTTITLTGETGLAPTFFDYVHVVELS